MGHKLSGCPFCGCKLWYIEAFVLKNQPIYRCKNCKEKTSVQIQPSVFKFFWIIEVLSALVFVVSLFFGGEIAFLGCLLTVLIFSAFYAFTPYAVSLGYPKKKNFQADMILKKCENPGVYRESRKDTEKEIYSN